MSSTPTQEELFSSLPVPVALRRMILPAAISQIIVLIYNMADTFYIGRTDNPYMLAGASLILPVFNMLLCLASLAGIGGGTLISRLMGAGQPQEARKVSAFSFYLAILLSLAFSVGLGVFMDPALRFLGATDSFLLYARQYSFCVIVLGAGPTVLSSVMAHLVRSVGLSKEAGFGITLGAVLNILLDPVFMYLLLPDGQQVLGVGIATPAFQLRGLPVFSGHLLPHPPHQRADPQPHGGAAPGRQHGRGVRGGHSLGGGQPAL